MIRSHFARGVSEQGDMKKGSFQRRVIKFYPQHMFCEEIYENRISLITKNTHTNNA